MAISYSGDTTLKTAGPGAGGYDIGVTGIGSLLVDGGSTEVWGNGTTQDPFGTIGRNAGASGTVTITGAFSRLILDGIGGDTRLHVGSSGTGTLNVLGGGEFVIDNAVTATGTTSAGFTVGRTTGADGTLNVTDGTVTVNGYGAYLNVGRDGGTGDANLSDATVDLSGANNAGLQIGRGTGATGTMDLLNGTVVTLSSGGVPGAQNQFAGSFFNVGRAGGTGTLNIDASSFILDDTVDAADATDFFSTGGNIGRDNGTGVVNLTNGALWSIDSMNSDAFMRIGRQVGGDGTLNVDATSTFAMTGGNGANLQAGRDGGVGVVNLAGTAMLDGGAGFTSMTIGRSGDGTLNLTGSASITGLVATLDVGGGAGAVGDLQQDGTLDITAAPDGTNFSFSRILIGSQGGTGTADFSGTTTVSGPGLTDFTGFNVGLDQDSVGVATLETGSMTTVSGRGLQLFVGTVFGAASGTGNADGTVTIQNGATLAISGDNLAGGIGQNGTGTLTVAGTLDVDTQTGGNLSIGSEGGDGTFVSVGGQTTMDAALGGGSFFSLNVGDSFNGASTGLLRLQSGADFTIDADNALTGIGQFTGSNGQMQVVSGSTFTSVGGMGVASDGQGATGSLFVDGTGSQVSIAENLNVGFGSFLGAGTSDATATIQNGARLDVGGFLTVERGGQLSTGDATIGIGQNGTVQDGGTWRLLDGTTALQQIGTGPVPNLNIGGTGSTDLIFEINAAGSSSGEIVMDGITAFVQPDVEITIAPQGGLQFTGGETYTLARSVNGGNFAIDSMLPAANVSVTGQSADFGWLFGQESSGDVVFEALNAGDGMGDATLDFGSTSAVAAIATYDTDAGTLDGSGGLFMKVIAYNLDFIRGTAAGDILTATGSGSFALFGREGDDVLTAGDGGSLLVGGLGGDALNGGTGFDTASYVNAASGVVASLATGMGTAGEAAGDTFNGIEALDGSLFNDTLVGDGASNTLFGFDGNDVLEGGLGPDGLDGGNGFDTAFYGNASGTVIANLTNSAVNTGEAAGDAYTSIERIVGSAFTDALTGDANANALVGGGGNDFLIGLSGNDVLLGGGGGDRLEGGLGADQLDGGAAFDIAFYRNATTGPVTVDLAAGSGSGGEAQGDTYTSIEIVTGTFFADTLLGDSGINGLTGSGGNDVLDGRGGNDTLFGSVGNDTFRFQNNHGNDRVLDFGGGSGTDADVLDYSQHTDVNAIGDLTIFDSGTGNTVIQDGAGGQVVLLGVAAATIDASDFVF